MNKCQLCKEMFDDSETYEYRGFMFCEEHFDEGIKRVDEKRSFVMEVTEKSVRSQAGGEWQNGGYKTMKTDASGRPITKVKEPEVLKEFSEQVMLFLRGSTRKDLANIKTGIKKGSLALVAENETGVLDDVVDDYLAVYSDANLGQLDPVRARMIERWQLEAKRYPNREYRLSVDTDEKETREVIISSETDFSIDTDVWVDVELYLHGRIFDLGGKTSPNVHIELENGKTLTIESSASLLTGDSENRLYKRQLVRVSAKRSLGTGELKDERLLSFERYSTDYNEELMEKIYRKAEVAWADVKDTTKWVENLRGSSA